jgi:signal transduction histidine kinase
MDQRVGESLFRRKGFTPSTGAGLSATFGRALGICLPAAALVFGLGGLAIGVGEPTLTGLSLEPPGGHVQSVDPTSLAWAAGIRPGQIVVAQSDAQDPAGWSVITRDGDRDHALTARALAAAGRLSVAGALAATILGLLGLAGAGHHRRRAEFLGTIGLGAAFIPFAVTHDPGGGGAILAFLPGIASAVWLARWSAPRALAMAILVAFFMVELGWFVARASGSALAADIDNVRFGCTIVVLAGVGAIGAGVTPRALARRSATLRTMDVLAFGVLIAALASLQLVLGPPLWTLVGVLVVVALGYGGLRAVVRRGIDRLIFAEQRERTSIESAESERARLSRALHDDPLQALAGVILSLERQPNTAAERETLRTLAGQLRNIATSLHPPVLDDLGLVPAIESMFAEAGPVPIELDLDNRTGYRPSERAPFEVELATYRIVQEAATNALRHSGCHRIVVRGQVSPDAVSIDVVDDGRGFGERDAEIALRGGHIGLASMRRRAEAIDADLVHVEGQEAGTTVRLRWTG